MSSGTPIRVFESVARREWELRERVDYWMGSVLVLTALAGGFALEWALAQAGVPGMRWLIRAPSPAFTLVPLLLGGALLGALRSRRAGRLVEGALRQLIRKLAVRHASAAGRARSSPSRLPRDR